MGRPLILVDAGPFPESTVGIGQVRLQYAAAVMDNPNKTFDFRFLVHPRDTDTRATGVKTGKVRYSPSFILRHLLNREKSRFSRYLYTGQDHALRHVTGHAFFKIPRTESAPLLYTLHDTHFFSGAEYNPTTARNIISLAQRAQAVAFISKYTQEQAQDFLPMEGKLLQVIYNGVNKPGRTRRPSWHTSNRPFFLCLSQIIPHKNYHVLAPVMDKLPQYDLVIAGKNTTPYAKEVEEQFLKVGMRNRLMMPGNVAEEEKAWLYENCVALLHPSLREGFGMSVIEAFHLGKPVFCSNNTALKEIGKKYAYFWNNYEPDYLLESLNRHLPNAMANDLPKARQIWAKRFSWKRNFDDYCALYGEILDRHKIRQAHIVDLASRRKPAAKKQRLPTILVDSAYTAKSMASGIGQVCLQYASAIAHYQPQEFDFQFLRHPKNYLLQSAPYERISASWNPLYFRDKLLLRRHHAQRYCYLEGRHDLRHVLSGHAFFDLPPTDTAPVIWTVHDAFLLDDAATHSRIVQRLHALAQRATAIVFISEHTKRSFNKQVNIGHKEQFIIYNGVSKPANPLRPRWLDGDMPFLLGLGQLVHHKNFNVLLQMMLKLPDYRLLLAGKSNNAHARELRIRADVLGLGDRVLMPGVLSEEEKAWLLKNCAAYLHPSLGEGFGMSVIEAFHFGKPVFCSRNTALVEVGGKHAYFWDRYEPDYLAHSIETHMPTANSPKLCLQRRAWAERFSWKKNLDAYLELYRHVLDMQRLAAE